MVKRRAFHSGLVIKLALAVAVSSFVIARAGSAWANDEDEERRYATFVAFSRNGDDSERISMEGLVQFDALEEEVSGGGSWVYLNNAAPGLPKPVLNFGTWKAKEFVSYELCPGFPNCRYGRIESSIIEMIVKLKPDRGRSFFARVRLICNIGAAGIMTGEPEGFILTAPFGRFDPILPPLGLTHVSIPLDE